MYLKQQGSPKTSENIFSPDSMTNLRQPSSDCSGHKWSRLEIIILPSSLLYVREYNRSDNAWKLDMIVPSGILFSSSSSCSRCLRKLETFAP